MLLIREEDIFTYVFNDMSKSQCKYLFTLKECYSSSINVSFKSTLMNIVRICFIKKNYYLNYFLPLLK